MKREKDYQNYIRLIGYAKKHIPLFVICTILSGAMVFLIFSSVGVLLSSVVGAVSGESSQTSSHMFVYIIGVFGFSLLASFSQLGFVHIEQKTQLFLRQTMLHQYLKMKESFASQYSATEVLNRLTTDIPNCTTSIGYYMSAMVFQPMISGLFSIILLLAIDWRITLLCVSCTVLNLFCSRFAMKRTRELKVKMVKGKSDTANFIQECAQGETEIRTFGLFPIFERKLQKQVQETGKTIKIFSHLQGIRIQLYTFSGDCFTIVSLLTLGAILAGVGVIPFSNVMIALPLSDQISQMMTAFGNGTVIIKQASPHIERVFEIMDLPEESTLVEKEQDSDRFVQPIKDSNKEISFSHISFSYGQKKVLDDISFSIEKGEKVAFVGESGSGKSTIMKLLLGLYPAQSGTIQACGKEFGNCSMEEWRKNFSYLSQNISLFHLTVAENIALSLGSVDEKIRDAVRRANAEEFLLETEKGYDLILGENNAGFSGGQLQRIALARCLYKDAPIIVMDEPTSALDQASEQAVKKTIDQLPKTCTVVAVTHRLELTRNFDRLYVVENGKIVESGTHQQLLEQGGKYRHLWQLQNG
ncbi:MAG: ABC transporter ATP-binding protein [Clostridiales bacterium]|nr:ABC transporter ATP-binding protein [Clostridiales bacterium]